MCSTLRTGGSRRCYGQGILLDELCVSMLKQSMRDSSYVTEGYPSHLVHGFFMDVKTLRAGSFDTLHCTCMHDPLRLDRYLTSNCLPWLRDAVGESPDLIPMEDRTGYHSGESEGRYYLWEGGGYLSIYTE